MTSMIRRYTFGEYIVEPCRDKTQPHQALPMIFHTGRCLDSQMDPGNHNNTLRINTKLEVNTDD